MNKVVKVRFRRVNLLKEEDVCKIMINMMFLLDFQCKASKDGLGKSHPHHQFQIKVQKKFQKTINV